MKAYFTVAAMTVGMLAANAQHWDDVGNAGMIPGTYFLGTTDFYPLDIRTEDIHRFRLLPDATYAINSFGGQVKDGSLLICPDITQFNGPGPFTRLHLADGIAGLNDHEVIYRDWMKNGITMTGNGDGMYVGQRYNEGEDRTDATITWSDNPGEWRRDRLTFNFVSGTGQDESGCDSPYGIQTMLVQPDEDCRQAYVGIGDFDSMNETPGERLDVLDRTMRIRDFSHPTAYLNASADRVLVADPLDGTIYWRPENTINTSADCTWEENVANRRMTTAWRPFGTNNSCPEQDWRVGIGTNGFNSVMNYKLNIHQSETDCAGCGVTGGLSVSLRTDATPNGGAGDGGFFTVKPAAGQTTGSLNGVRVETDNGSTSNNGIYTTASTASTYATNDSHGVLAISKSTGGAITHSYGVRGRSRRDSGSITSGYGVYGDASGSTAATGVYGSAEGIGTGTSTGVLGYAFSSPANKGVSGTAVGAGTTNYGVQGTASGANTNYAIHGTVSGTGNNFAGYFTGNVWVSGVGTHPNGIWTPSDAELKTNVQDIANATELISALEPKVYEHAPQEHPHLDLPEGVHMGLIAQELQEVIPGLVRPFTLPALVDSTAT